MEYVVNLIYLAQPYSADTEEGMEARYEAALCATVRLLDLGNNVLSPIVHSHPLTRVTNASLPGNWDFWEGIDMDLIDRCDVLGVMCLPGWEYSVGVTAEIKYAKENDIPVIYLPAEIGDEIQEQTGTN